MAETRARRGKGGGGRAGGGASLPPLPDDGGLSAQAVLPMTTPGTVHGSLVPNPTSLPPVRDPLSEFFHDSSRDGVVAETERTRPLGADALDQRGRILLFRLGNEEYGVSIMDVREILKQPPLTEVPRAPAHVLGVFSLRGQVLPVVTLSHVLGVADDVAYGAPDARVLVVGRGEDAVGLHVHRVAQVVRMSRQSLEPPPGGLVGQRRALLQGLGRVDDRLIIVLELSQVLAALGLGPQAGEGT